jgi:hypothetical protein
MAVERATEFEVFVEHRIGFVAAEITDRGAAQFDGVDAQATAALGGKEGDHVEAAGGQAGQPVLVAPGTPGAHPGAVGAPRVCGFGPGRSRF